MYFWLWLRIFVFMWNKIFDGIDEKLLPSKAGPIALLNLSIIHWSLSKYMTWNKKACSDSELNPVQSSRSKLTTCPRKGRLLRFLSNSTATSDGRVQKLGNDVWHDAVSTATKVCSQIFCKWNAMFESHVVTSVERTSFDFWVEEFFSNLPLYCVTDRPSITWSWRSVLNFKISVLTFLRSMSCSTSNEQKLCKVKILQLRSPLNAIRCIDKRFASNNSGRSCLALIFNLSNPRQRILQCKICSRLLDTTSHILVL